MNLDTIFNQLRIWESRHEILVACDQKCANLLGGMISHFVLHSVNHLHHTPSHNTSSYHAYILASSIGIGNNYDITGIQSAGSKYPCVYCHGTKSVRGKKGLWRLGTLRTPKSIRDSHQEWAMKHHGRLDSKKATDDLRLKYHNTHR